MGGDNAACGTAAILKQKDELSDRLLANAVATCKPGECEKVSNFIQQEMRNQGCTSPYACPDAATLSQYWRVAQQKAQGLEAVYPETWLLDAKAALDLTKYGVRALAGAGTSATGSLEALGQLGRADAAAVQNNFYRDGVIADPTRPMSATGPWRSAAEITPAQADQLISSRLPSGVQVNGVTSANLENTASIGAGYQAPYLPGSNLVEFTTTQPTQFVRVFGGSSRQPGGWVMRAEDIAGLTPEQIASKYSLPQVPTMVTDVSIPAGTRLNASVANNISPGSSRGILTGDNVGGGGVQFQIQVPQGQEIPAGWFANPRSLR